MFFSLKKYRNLSKCLEIIQKLQIRNVMFTCKVNLKNVRIWILFPHVFNHKWNWMQKMCWVISFILWIPFIILQHPGYYGLCAQSALMSLGLQRRQVELVKLDEAEISVTFPSKSTDLKYMKYNMFLNEYASFLAGRWCGVGLQEASGLGDGATVVPDQRETQHPCQGGGAVLEQL